MTDPASDPTGELVRVRSALAALIHDADDQINHADRDRQLILEHLLDELDALASTIHLSPVQVRDALAASGRPTKDHE